MTLREKFSDLWHRATEWYHNQPDIRVIPVMPRNQPEVKPFQLEGKMLITDHKERKISEGGSSSHVTIPPSMVSQLRSPFNYCGLFEAYGKTGLIFLCKQEAST